MRGCGFGKMTQKEFLEHVKATFDEMSVEERETIRSSSNKSARKYAELERAARKNLSSLKVIDGK